jgi:heavy metal sensor kinase
VNTRSLKFRLVVWYAGWLTLLFIVFGIFVYTSLGYYLRRDLREALARRARQVADLVQRSSLSKDKLGHEIHIHFAPEANNRLTRVIVDGTMTYVSGPPSDASFDPRTAPLAHVVNGGESFGRRVAPDGRALFVLVVARDVNGKRVIVEEGSAEAPIRATLQAWLMVLVLGLAVLIIGAAAGGFVLVGRSLAPVDRIIRSAEQISSRNLNERLPVTATGDELERLSIALNNMIRRLDDAFQHTQRFLADASHELRTPLTMLRAELDHILEKTEKTEVRQFANSALEEVNRLRKIVEGLFALSRLDAGEAIEQWAQFDLGQLATTTAEQMCLLAEDKDISIRCNSADNVIVEGDRARLKQVTVNLLDNAIKYTPQGGKIEVRVAKRENRAVMEIADTGVGIPNEALPRLFERFFRVDKARSRELGGAGLGLSIVRSICMAHGGKVEVESKPGEGTRFTVELALASARKDF